MIYKIEISEREKTILEDAIQTKINLCNEWKKHFKEEKTVARNEEYKQEYMKLQKKLKNLSLLVK